MPTFNTPEPISATIDFVVGDARITASDRDDTVVEVRPSDKFHEPDVRVAEQTRVEYGPADCWSRRRSNAVSACSARSDRSM